MKENLQVERELVSVRELISGIGQDDGIEDNVSDFKLLGKLFEVRERFASIKENHMCEHHFLGWLEAETISGSASEPLGSSQATMVQR